MAMQPVQVLITGDPDLLPSYAHPGDAGADLRASEAAEIAAGQWALVPTSLSIALPDGFVALVHPRSGLAIKHGVTVLNAPGTIDAGYRGEIKVALINHGTTTFRIERGDRIAQLLIQEVHRLIPIVVDTLPGTARGTGGFGSTGLG